VGSRIAALNREGGGVGRRQSLLITQAGDPAGAGPESEFAGIAGAAGRFGERLAGRFLDGGNFFSFRTNAFSRFLAAFAAFFACLYALRARLKSAFAASAADSA